jgi:hypothetical protein
LGSATLLGWLSPARADCLSNENKPHIVTYTENGTVKVVTTGPERERVRKGGGGDDKSSDAAPADLCV